LLLPHKKRAAPHGREIDKQGKTPPFFHPYKNPYRNTKRKRVIDQPSHAASSESSLRGRGEEGVGER